MDDTLLQYKCTDKDCGKLTTEYRRIRIAWKIGDKEYEAFKCPYCRGKLVKIDPVEKQEV